MAERRSSIVVDVAGLKDVRDLNRALTDHKQRLLDIATAYQEMGAGARFAITSLLGMSTQLGKVTGGLKEQQTQLRNLASAQNSVTRANRDVSDSMAETHRVTTRTTTAFGDLLKQAVQYRAISLVFHEVTDAVRETFQATMDFERQISRVRRVTDGNVSTGVVRAGMFEEMARTGQGAKELGEAFYQLGTFVKDTDTLLSAVRTTMTLVVGTESDVRESARAIMQVYNQFGDQLDKTVSSAENFRRIGEAIAVTYKMTNTEVGELTQALKYLGPLADAARVPVAQLMGVLGGLEAGGVRGRQAGTSASQFIAQLLKRSTEGDDLVAGKKIYSGIIQRVSGGAADGGLDLLATLTKIRDHLNELNLKKHTREADEFVIAMGGTQNAVRFVGTLTQTLERMRAVTEKNVEAFKGLTHEADRLKDIMLDNLPAQMQRAWASALANMTDNFGAFAKGIGLTRLLVNFADKREGRDTAETEMQTRFYGSRPSVMSGARVGALRAAQGIVDRTPRGRLPFVPDQSGLSTTEYDWLSQIGVIGGSGVINRTLLGSAMAAQMPAYQRDLYTDRTGPQGEQGEQSAMMGAAANAPRASSGVTSRLNDAQLEALRRKRDAANRAAAQKLRYEASELRARANLLLDRYSRRNDDNPTQGATAAEMGAYDALNASAFAKEQQASTLTGDPRMGRYARMNAAGDNRIKDLNRRAQGATLNRNADRAAGDYGDAEDIFGLLSPDRMTDAKRADAAERAKLVFGHEDTYALDQGRGRAGKLESQIEDYWHKAQGDVYDDAYGKWRAGPQGQNAFGVPNATLMAIMKAAPGLAIERMREQAANRDFAVESGTMSPLDAMQGNLLGAQRTVGTLQGNTGPEGMKALKEAEQQVVKLTKAIRDYRASVREGKVDLANELFGKDAEARLAAFAMSDMPVRAGMQKAYGISRQQGLADLYMQLSRESNDPEVSESWRQKAVEVQHSMRYDSAARRIAREDEERGGLQSAATQGAIGLFHGTASVKSAVRGYGDSLIDKGISKFMEKLFDPQAFKINQQIEAADRNTGAINTLTATISGTSINGTNPVNVSGSAPISKVLGLGAMGAALAVGAGAMGGGAGRGAQGASRGGRKTYGSPGSPEYQNKPISSYGISDVVNVGSAAYSVFSQGYEHGVTLGGVLGGYMAGSAIGGPVGGVIGAGLDIIGGLFHKKSAPTFKDQNPAFWNSPSQFDYNAYRYRATGIVPTDATTHMFKGNTPTITVNVITDGVKKAVAVQLASAVQTGRAATVNAWYDSHVPS